MAKSTTRHATLKPSDNGQLPFDQTAIVGPGDDREGDGPAETSGTGFPFGATSETSPESTADALAEFAVTEPAAPHAIPDPETELDAYKSPVRVEAQPKRPLRVS